MKIKSSSGFNITSSNEGFANRQKNIFGQLDGLMEQDSKTLFQNAIEPKETNDFDEKLDWNDSKRNPKPRNFRGKESIFKKPHSPFHNKLQISKIPDFKKNPHKWTKYTLNDVSAEDMSDKSNMLAAMSFLKDLQKRKDDETMDVESAEKVVFNKSRFYKPQIEEVEDHKKSFVNSKLVMPEYVVGQVSKPKKERKSKPENTGQEIKLTHLDFEDETE